MKIELGLTNTLPANKSLHWTAQAGFLLKGHYLQNWSKSEVTKPVKLVYNQASVCTPTLNSL